MIRPYRLMVGGKQLRWRYYAVLRNAHNATLIEARWAKVGTCIEVVNVTRGRMLGQYTRTLTSISFLKGEQHDLEAESSGTR